MGSRAGVIAPQVDDTAVTFHVTDPDRRLRGVRLCQDAGLSRRQLSFARAADGWWLRVDRPSVDRLEYLFEVRDADGVERVLDEGNPSTAAGVFGLRSVVEFPGYRKPWWRAGPHSAGSRRELSVWARTLHMAVPVTLWTPAGCTEEEPLPLLVVHDGQEYARYGGFTDYSAALIDAGELPPHRIALVSPVHREDWYSANPAYAPALCASVLSTIRREVPVAGRLVGVGVSLGALAMLHAEQRYPGTFGGLFLQSGSYFVPVYDRMEAGNAWFGRVVRWVSAIRRAGVTSHHVPITLTCGTVEENLRNNRIMWRTLARQQHAATLIENRDAHNYTGWRDCLDPHLTRLLRGVWPVT